MNSKKKVRNTEGQKQNVRCLESEFERVSD